MILLPPGVPITISGLSSLVTMVGLIELKGRFDDSITSILLILLLSNIPVPAAMTRAPNQSLSV